MNKNSIASEVLNDIRNQLNPLLKKLETSMIISNVKNLAEQLITFRTTTPIGVPLQSKEKN